MADASLHVTRTAWLATIGIIAALIAFDMLVSGRRPHAVGFKEAVAQSSLRDRPADERQD